MLKVLIVDDEPINHDILLEYLAGTGYALDTANDGAEAWAMLEADPQGHDIVLLDRMMPRMDGMEVLRRMKAHAELRYVPVILQTAKRGTQEIAEGIEAGAFYYLTKPYDEAVLRSVVATAAEDRRNRLDLVAESRRGAITSSIAESARFTLRDLDQANALAAFLANACPAPEAAVTGFSELLINAIEHGNLAIGYDEKSALKAAGTWQDEVVRRLRDPAFGDKRVTVEFQRGASHIEVSIRDEGPGFDWARYLEFDPERAMDNHGRGIAMARAFSFDDIEYRGCGNEVVARIGLAAVRRAA
ncbi:MAG: response regulator [Gammaproteobacteria bacterium]|nr:response regulator [Gammaproteobacteria bacterium]